MVQTLGCGPTVGSPRSSSAPPSLGRGRVVPPPPPLNLKLLPHNPHGKAGIEQGGNKHSVTVYELIFSLNVYCLPGVWVQCDSEMCLKWRYLQQCADPSALPQYWTCSMNTEDTAQSK